MRFFYQQKLFLFVLFFFVFSQVLAQTAPGGIGNSDGSDGQPIVKLWLLPDSLGLNDGDNVTTWTDHSGNNNHLVTGNTSIPPVYGVDSLNGHSIIEFAADRSHLVKSSFDMPSDAVTLFYVLRAKENSGQQLCLFSYEKGQNEFLLLEYPNDGDFGTFIEGNRHEAVFDYADNNWKILSHQWRSSDGKLRLHTNGTEIINTNHRAGATIATAGTMSIGAEQDGEDSGYSSSQDFEDGEIAELIMYGSSLKQAQRVVIENYLAQKYGLDANLATDHYVPDDGSYIVALTGMGKESDGTISLSSDGLVITQNGGFENGEYIFAAHDGTENTQATINTSADVTSCGVDSAWNRAWYVYKSDINGVDAKIAFDLSEGINGDYPGNINHYRLLYRASLSVPYDTIAVGGRGIQNGDQIYFAVDDAHLNNGYYTLGSVDATESPLNGIPARTWYTLISGDWENWEVWTLDPSGALPNNPNMDVPASNDKVVIFSGKTVTVNDNGLSHPALTVNGRLDLQGTSGHSFGEIRGTGRILLSGDNFPTFSDASHFYSQGRGEGTVEYYGNSFDLNLALEFYNLTINLDDAAQRLNLLTNYTINGNLNIEQGEFQINDNSATSDLSITVQGDVTVSENAKISTGSADARHQFNIFGDFTNNGEAEFTSNLSTDYGTANPNYGIVDLNFLNSAANQNILCNGLTSFYRIEIDKGTDITYELSIEATDAAYFNLYGYAGEGHGSVEQLTDNANALGLIKGTVRIKNNVDIPVLCTATNYNISESARLWVDGGTVFKNSGNAIVPYGIVKVSSGTLEARIGSGITIRGDGLIKNDGGTITVNQIRTSVYGSSHVGGYYQSGGTTNILGGNTSTDYYCFNLTYGGNVFNMSGGTLHIHEAHGKGGIFIASDEVNQYVSGGTVIFEISDGNDFPITSKAPFWNVIIRNSNSGSGKHILTNGENVGATNEDLAVQDLHVLNDLTIETGTTRSETAGGVSNTYGSYLDLVPDNATPADLYVGGDLTIEDSGVLDIWAWDGNNNDGSATVTFNGNENAILYVGDIATYTNSLVQFKNPDDGPWPTGFDGADETYGVWTLPFYNLIIDKPNATLSLASKLPGKGHGSPHGNPAEYRNANGGKNISRIGNWLLRITNKIAVLNGTLSQIDPLSTVTMLENDGSEFGDVGDPVDYSIAISNAEIINKDTLFIYEDGVTPKNGSIIFRIGGDLTLETSEEAFFGNFSVNNSTTTGISYELKLTSDVKMGRMQFSGGILDIGTHNLKVDVFEFMPAEQTLEQSDGQAIYTTNDFIRMAGNASDGGLSIKLPRSLTLYESPTPSFPDPAYTKEINVVDRVQYYEDGQEYNTPDRLWFPVGTDASGSDKYTPAVMYITDDSGVTYDGNEYITLRVVDSELQTTDLSGGDIISYYWNVEHEGFDSGLPQISWIFQYDDSDISGAEDTYVPGKVLDDGNYTRSSDGDATGVKHSGASGNNGDILGTNPNNIILFNGITGANDDIDNGTGDAVFDRGIIDNNWTNAFPGTGITLENANYTAGEANRFVGSPDIYYSIRESGYGDVWNTPNSWYDSPTGNTHPSDFPGAGDVVVIRGDNFMDDIVVNGTRECAELVFQREGTYVNIEDLPRLRFQSTDQLTAGEIKGQGDIYLQYDMTNQPVLNADIGDFASSDTSLVLFYMTQDGLYEISESEFFANVPTLRIYGQLDPDRTVQFDYDLNAKSLIVDGEATLRVGGNYTVENYTRLGDNYHGNLEFPNGANSFSFRTKDLLTGNTKNGNELHQITALAGNTNDVAHKLIVERNIELSSMDGESSSDNVVIDLYNPSPENSVILELQDDTDGSFVNNFSAANSTVELYRVVMNKGTDTTSTFTFEDNFTLNGPTSGVSVEKAIELQNGKLILNNPNINVDLTTGDDDFYIPGSAGLEVRQGTANASGNSGIILDGKLQVSGGTVDMSGGDNYIQYSATGNATLEITGGTLNVGSQIRRGLTSSEGILHYKQSGGTVAVGTHSAQKNNRGVFEILNPESSFSHTGGSFYIARAQNNPSIASLYLAPENATFGEGTEIRIGHSTTPAGEEISIYSNIPIPNLVIDNSSGKAPMAKMWTVPLTISDTLEIQTGAKFNCNGQDLYIEGDLIINNNGTFTPGPGGNTTYFSGTVTQEVYGETEFYNLTKTNSNTLTFNSPATVSNVLDIQDGTFADGGNTISVMGYINNDGIHDWGDAGDGIYLNGSLEQRITTSGLFGKITIDNPNGVFIPTEADSILIDDAVELRNGVFDIGKNLLVLDENAIFIEGNAYSDQNMVQTNISFTDNGIKKYFPAISATETFVFPLGSESSSAYVKYTPVELSIDQMDAGGYIRVKAADGVQFSITDDADECDEFDDTKNALNYYWVLEAKGVTNFTGQATMTCYQDDALFDNIYNYDLSHYITARLLLNSDEWNKYDQNSFDETNFRLYFSFSETDDDGISGEYTAGIEQGSGCNGAIPNKVPTYITVQNGNWNQAGIWETYPDGNAGPAGGPRGAIVIVQHNVEILNNYKINYKTCIRESGVIDVGTTFGHVFGTVYGTGEIYLESGNMPAAVYDGFVAADSGKFHFGGTTNYDILSELPTVNDLKFSGTGERRFPNLTMNINGDIQIDGTDASLNVINEYNNLWHLAGNLNLATGSFSAGTGSAEIDFHGSSAQNISGDFTGSNAFFNVKLQNPNGVALLSPVEIANELNLNTGNIISSATNPLTLTNTDQNIVSGASNASFIDGTLKKNILAGGSFSFPVGDAARLGNVQVQNVSANQLWEAEYFNHNPANESYDPESFATPLEYVSHSEYWRIKSPASLSAKVKIRWDSQSNVSSDAADRSKLRIAQWDNTEWIDVGNDVNDNGQNDGTISSTNSIALNEHFFTIATSQFLLADWQGDDATDPTNWSVAENWSNAKVPAFNTKVTIPDRPNDPIISTDAQADSLSLEADAELTINPGYSLQIGGDFTFNGTLRLKSDASGTANLVDNGTITGSGTAFVERYVRQNVFHYVSAPLSAVDTAIFTLTSWGAINPNFYTYNQDIASADWMLGWEKLSQSGHSATLQTANGYAYYYTENDVVEMTGGNLNTGTIQTNVYNSPNGVDANGWNLIGNPYPSALDAQRFIDHNTGAIHGSLYFWDDDQSGGSDYQSADYAAWNVVGSVGAGGNTPNGVISNSQAFFVKAPANGTVEFTNAMRLAQDAHFFKNQPVNEFQKIKLSLSGNKNYNEILIAFHPQGTTQFHPRFDAVKLQGNPQLSFFVQENAEKYAIKTLPPLAENQRKISLGFNAGEKATYQIQLKNLENWNDLGAIYLEDTYLGSTTNLKTDSSYSFNSNAGNFPDRFLLSFFLSDNPAEAEIEPNSLSIFAYRKEIVLRHDSLTIQKAQVFDIAGRKVAEKQFDSQTPEIRFRVKAQTGVYFVKVFDSTGITTEKVYLH